MGEETEQKKTVMFYAFEKRIVLKYAVVWYFVRRPTELFCHRQGVLARPCDHYNLTRIFIKVGAYLDC
jgi:hypothetical protein